MYKFNLTVVMLLGTLGLGGCTITASDYYGYRGTHYYGGTNYYTPHYRYHPIITNRYLVPQPVIRFHLAPKKKVYVNRPFLHHKKKHHKPRHYKHHRR